ncbi:MAG: 3'-5' exonuclease [Candidatus Polarisedimenticolaceae bacterium]|nr:3'-5' exonuclease [Candidatus Polarisedimenticolaceae bacterium]
MVAQTVIVLDFETTGLSPAQGDRAIEIGAVLIEQGVITGRFQRLMNPGRRIDRFIEEYTGITNAMVRAAAPCAEVMDEFADFIGDYDLVAHNASFDQRFLDAELQVIQRRYSGQFACSMLTARRLYPAARNHKLGTLVAYKNLPTDGTYHRALADAEMTAHLWLAMLADIKKSYAVSDLSFAMMQKLGKVPKGAVEHFFNRQKSA